MTAARANPGRSTIGAPVRTILALLALLFLFSSAQLHADPVRLSSGDPVTVTAFRFVGNTAFSDVELADVAAPFLHKQLFIEDLESLRVALSQHYLARGHLNSGAAIDDQDVIDGLVTIRIIEGTLTEVNFSGLKYWRPGPLAARLQYAAGTPLAIDRLQEALLLLNRDVTIKRLNAELKPGLSPGTAALSLAIAEHSPYHLALLAGNKRAPSIGAEFLEVSAAHHNLLGFGDQLAASYLLANGDEFSLDADNFSLSYAIPVHPSGTTIGISYQRDEDAVIEEPLDLLDVTSESEALAVILRQPIIQTSARELALTLSTQYRTSRTYLAGIPTPFTTESADAHVKLAVVRLGAEFVQRATDRVLSARTTASFGTDWFNVPDQFYPNGQFAALLSQASYVQRLGANWQVSLKATAQWTNEPLPSLERLSIGGRDTVRGYRENQLVRDRGTAASIELQRNLWTSADHQSRLAVAAFFDSAYADNIDGSDSPPHQISSLGVGVVAHLWNRLDAELYWGHPLRDFNAFDHDLQDDGIHFNLVFRAF